MKFRANFLPLLIILAGLFQLGVRGDPTTLPATTRVAATQYGPDVVMLDKLVDLYQPVPFDHRTHAEMAEMWDGCVTCHHRPPGSKTQSAEPNGHARQEDSTEIPACKSCHPIAPEQATIGTPTLKGAYHRQCLNCHREWTGENACVACHAPRDGQAVAAKLTPDDIVGRMHPPVKAPKEKLFRARFTPVAGANVLFRHDEHTYRFGLKCVNCHRRDNCADCHHKPVSATQTANQPDTQPVTRPVTQPVTQPVQVVIASRSWKQTHTPCISCHQNDSCNHCHYPDDGIAPEPFSHVMTTQRLDEDHEQLDCAACHQRIKMKESITCGDARCHSKRPVSYPQDRPGRRVLPATQPHPSATQSTTAPATRPTILRIRRGGS